ncbi:uncharacterized protein LOC126458383 [Schistocerca serialis cubense]|uniref:uncharacterized protein LOC126458383 n=1 Tax=Schistocerca serialis cubense TaxID=2023355 RepID=UPI00214F30B2|nr:uncharacterized protein LOC126458383 [Schistocerca serialis cubense]
MVFEYRCVVFTFGECGDALIIVMNKLKLLDCFRQLSRCYSQRALVCSPHSYISGTAVMPKGITNPNFKEICFTGTKVTSNYKIFQLNDRVTTSFLQFSPNVTQRRPVPPVLDAPNVTSSNMFELPACSVIDYLHEIPVKDISVPTVGNVTEKIAARLIVIRRRKMKKHKLRKLRKRMKFEWAKVRQRRELRKEKKFQAGLIKKIKIAESFDAKAFVAQKLAKAHAAKQTIKS